MRILCSISVILLALSTACFAQAAGGPIAEAGANLAVPENDEARTRLVELLYSPLTAPPAPRVVEQQSTGTRVKFETEAQNGHVYYLFQNEEASAFSIAGRGNYVIKRAVEGGGFVQIKVFYREDPGCFVRLFPHGNRTSMDVYLFAVPVDRGVLLPVAFEDLLTEPFSRVIDLTRSTVRWESLLYRRWGPFEELTLAHVDSIRRFLPALSDRDDGAMDAEGRYVFIETGAPQGDAGGLNCSGFAKWVSDGFYFGLTGRYLAIEPLKDKHLEHRGNRWSLRFEEERDPYFGLDWSRNLATALWRAQGYAATGPEDFDVQGGGYVGYREDVGFPVEDLELLLFLEAAANPGHFYIGSLNREYGGQPVLRQHFHMVVHFPYFRADGSFAAAVFDTGSESTLPALIRRFPGAYIHLVRLPLGQSFLPPLPE